MSVFIVDRKSPFGCNRVGHLSYTHKGSFVSKGIFDRPEYQQHKEQQILSSI